MSTIYSSKLGWKDGQDVSAQFAALAATFKPGDVLVIEHSYKIGGVSIHLPNNFTIFGSHKGAGFAVQDTSTNSDPLLRLGDYNIFENITVSHPNAAREQNAKTALVASGENIEIRNSTFEGNAHVHVQASGRGLTVENSEFNGGHYQMLWLGEAHDFVVAGSLFHNAIASGIKTVPSGGTTYNALVMSSAFIDSTQSGIDTSGGFENSSIVDSFFAGNVAGLNVKSIYDDQHDPSQIVGINNGITITGCEFLNNNSHIALKTLDRVGLITPENSDLYRVQNMYVENSIFEHNLDGNAQVFSVKDAIDVKWDDIEVYGNLDVIKELGGLGVGNPHSNEGTVSVIGDARTGPITHFEAAKEEYGSDWSGQASTLKAPRPVGPSEPESQIETAAEDYTSLSLGVDEHDMLIADADTEQTLVELSEKANISADEARKMTEEVIDELVFHDSSAAPDQSSVM